MRRWRNMFDKFSLPVKFENSVPVRQIDRIFGGTRPLRVGSHQLQFSRNRIQCRDLCYFFCGGRKGKEHYQIKKTNFHNIPDSGEMWFSVNITSERGIVKWSFRQYSFSDILLFFYFIDNVPNSVKLKQGFINKHFHWRIRHITQVVICQSGGESCRSFCKNSSAVSGTAW